MDAIGVGVGCVCSDRLALFRATDIKRGGGGGGGGGGCRSVWKPLAALPSHGALIDARIAAAAPAAPAACCGDVPRKLYACFLP